jgi:phenylacetate-CoA ligase
VRMENITGRADDLLVVRGVNLYPSEIEHTIVDIDGVAPHTASTSTARATST